MLAQVADQRHLVDARLRAARLEFGDAFGLLLGGEFETLQVLERGVEIGLCDDALALELLQGRAKVFTASFDRAQE